MAKKTKRFVDSFVGDYIGDTPEKFALNLSALMIKSKQFLILCEEDISFAHTIYTNYRSQEARRVYIRALPPYIEGTLNFLGVVPYLYPPLIERIPEDCKNLFAESMLEFRNRSATKDNIKKTIIGFGKVSGIEISTNLMGEKGAQSLVKTLALRDNLMHPRSIEGMEVSDNQIQEANEGQLWYRKQFAAVISPLGETFKELLKQERNNENF